MTALRPGSAGWLLRHELRLAWRKLGFRSSRPWLIAGASLWLAYHLAPYGVLSVGNSVATVATPGASASEHAGAIGVMVGAALWAMFTLMVSHAITYSVDALFERGDLDLLLASPLEPRHVFLARGLGVAVSSVTLYALLLLPFAHVGLVTGHARLMAIYPALAALALLAAAGGLALTLLLVRVLGVRRARTVAQLLGAFVGAGFFLVMQAGNLFGDATLSRWWQAVRSAAESESSWWLAQIVRLPFDAMRGEPAALAALLTLGLGAFAGTVAFTARRFHLGTQESTAAARPSKPRADRGPAPRSLRFRSGLALIVLTKEWRLIARDPQIVAQTLLQVLYLVPLVFVWGRQGDIGEVLVPAIVLAATALASGLSWITVAAEDAPELVAAAPVDGGRVRRLKLLAALLPVWLLVAPAGVFLAATRPLAALVLGGCVLGATISAGLIHINVSRPGDRRQMNRRGKGNKLGAVLEMATSLTWSAFAWGLVVWPRYAAIAGVAALAAPMVALRIGRMRRREAAAA